MIHLIKIIKALDDNFTSENIIGLSRNRRFLSFSLI
jgi:hypothetical protein